MTCSEVRKRLRTGEPLDEAGELHLAECEACAELFESSALLGRALRAVPPPPDLAAGIEQGLLELQGELGRGPRGVDLLRRQGDALRVAVLLVFALAVCLVEVAAFSRPDLRLVPRQVLLGLGLVTLPTLLVGAFVAFRPLHKPPLAAWLVRLLLVLALAIPVLASTAAYRSPHPLAARGVGYELVPWALACFGHGAAVAALFAGVVALLDRGGRHTTPLLAAGLGGLFASFALELHCPVVHVAHRLLGHATVGFFALALTALLLRFFGRARHR